MADRATNEDVVNARVELAKARLAHLAAQADALPGPVDRAAQSLWRHPLRGVGVALLAGVVLGAARKRALPALIPMVVPAIRRVARAGVGRGSGPA